MFADAVSAHRREKPCRVSRRLKPDIVNLKQKMDAIDPQKPACVNVFRGTVEGQFVASRFLVGRCLDSGSFGSVYECRDMALSTSSLSLPMSSAPLVIKISSNHSMLGREIATLRNIQLSRHIDRCMYPADCVPHVLHKGLFVISSAEKKAPEDRSKAVAEADTFDSEDARADRANQGHAELDLKLFHERKEILAYYVMPRYGKNLEVVFSEHKHRFSLKTIL